MLCGEREYGKENWEKVALVRETLDPEWQYFMPLPVLINQVTWFLDLTAQAIWAAGGMSGWPALSHVPEPVVLVQVSKNLSEGLTLPFGHQLQEALAGLGGLGFLLY